MCTTVSFCNGGTSQVSEAESATSQESLSWKAHEIVIWKWYHEAVVATRERLEAVLRLRRSAADVGPSTRSAVANAGGGVYRGGRLHRTVWIRQAFLATSGERGSSPHRIGAALDSALGPLSVRLRERALHLTDRGVDAQGRAASPGRRRRRRHGRRRRRWRRLLHTHRHKRQRTDRESRILYGQQGRSQTLHGP